MNTEPDVTMLIGKLKAGDEDATSRIWELVFHRLRGYAQKKLGSHPRRDCDEEDLALSAMNALCVGAREGKFRQLDNREDLWQLLAMITSRKAANSWRKVMRRQEVGESNISPKGNNEEVLGGLAEAALADADQSFDLACNELLAGLDDRLRQVALMKWAGHTNQEIADEQGRSVKTIERYLNMIRRQWGEGAPMT